LSSPASPGSVTVLFCHGSRSPDWRVPFEQLAADFRQRFVGHRVRLAFLELMSPDLTQVLAEEAAAGNTAVRIVPLFLAPGTHTRRDLPALVDEARRRWPQLQIAVEPTVLESPALRQVLVAALGA
jgi:sirohydrochlorin cobaltochelatase